MASSPQSLKAAPTVSAPDWLPAQSPQDSSLCAEPAAGDARAGATAPTDSPMLVLTAGLSLKAEFHFEVDVLVHAVQGELRGELSDT